MAWAVWVTWSLRRRLGTHHRTVAALHQWLGGRGLFQGLLHRLPDLRTPLLCQVRWLNGALLEYNSTLGDRPVVAQEGGCECHRQGQRQGNSRPGAIGHQVEKEPPASVTGLEAACLGAERVE